MEDPPQQIHDAASFRDTAPESISVGHNGFPGSFTFNDPQMSSKLTWSGPSHAGSYFPPSNMISPNQSNPIHCTFAPVQISYYPLAYEQPLRHEPLPPQQSRYNLGARDNSTSYSQCPSSPEQNHGRFLSVSQLEGNDCGASEHAGGSSSSHTQPYTGDLTEHDADEGSDTMSDGIASNEGVYYSSGSDRDVFDDEDFGSFEVDSDEEYDLEYDSDEYSDN